MQMCSDIDCIDSVTVSRIKPLVKQSELPPVRGLPITKEDTNIYVGLIYHTKISNVTSAS